MNLIVKLMESFNAIGILPGPRSSFLDHLVPLCHLLNSPLYCPDQWVAQLAEIFYPDLVILRDAKLNAYQTFFYVEPSRMAHGSFHFDQKVYRGKARSICGLHGNSDKNCDTFWIERMVDEDIVLAYGDYMLDIFREKGIYDRLSSVIITGNYRRIFYEKHHAFFDAMAKPHLFPSSCRKTILYAPTWSYKGRHAKWNSSFFTVCSFVLDNLPDDFQIFVKLHPFYFYLYPSEVAEIKKTYEEKENIRFLDEIPLIYPFLEQTDIYLGDYSSIGYDFLFYNRPLFFLSQKEEAFLWRCGRRISFSEYPKLYSIIRADDQKELKEVRKAVYNYVFGTSKPLEELKQEIEQKLLS